MTKKKTILFIVGLSLALYFCGELTAMGFHKFDSALSNNFKEFDKPFPNQLTRLRIDLAYMGLVATYVIWLFQRQEKLLNFSKILRYAAVFLGVSLLTYPPSTDIYLYLHYGLMGLSKINPYLNPADSFISNLSILLSWSQSSTYGPIAQLFFMVSSLGTRVSPLLGVYIFKLFCVLFHIINAYLIWRFLKLSPYRSKITIAYLLNPLLLTEHIISAHVDVFIANALILLIISLYRRYYVAGILAIWLGFLEKTLPIIWLPLVLGFLVYKRRWKDLAISAFASLAIIAVVSYTALPTVSAWRSLINPGVGGKTALSLHYLLNATLSFTSISTQTSQSLLSTFTLLTYLGFISYYIFTLLKPYFRRTYTETNLVVDIGWVTLVLILFASPWLMSWYPTILLPVAALSTQSPLFILTSLTFCLSSNFIYGGAGSGISVFSIFSTLTIVTPPIAVLLIGRKLLERTKFRERFLSHSP